MKLFLLFLNATSVGIDIQWLFFPPHPISTGGVIYFSFLLALNSLAVFWFTTLLLKPKNK